MGSKWNVLKDVLGPATPGFVEFAGIAVGVIVLIWVTLRIKAWFRDDEARDENPVHLLSELEEMRREDGLTDEEFRLIKTRLAKAVVAKVGTPKSAITAGSQRGPTPSVSPPTVTSPLHGGSGASESNAVESSSTDGDPTPGSTPN